MKSNNLVKVIVAFSIIAVAGWLYRAGSSEDDIPNDPTATSIFMCTACNHVMELTDRELDSQNDVTVRTQAQNAADGQNEKPRAGRAAHQIRVLLCPACKKIAAKVARKCPTDGTAFLNESETGVQNVCPKCGWSPIVIPKRVSDE